MLYLELSYSQKYGLSLNLAVWFQMEHKKILAKFKFGSGASQRITSSVLLSSRLKYLKQPLSVQIYKKYNWHCAGAKLAIYCNGEWY